MSKISLKHSGGNVVSLNSPTSAPTSADVAFKLPNADGSSGQYMKTAVSGNLSFSSISETKPTITSSSLFVAPSTSTAVTIAGTNFVSVPIVEAINSSTGAITRATAVTFTSATSISATFNLASASYFVRVENNDGNAVRSSSAILNVSDAPTWTTSAGSLGSFAGGASFGTINLTATNSTSMAKVSGTFPGGMTLNSGSGTSTLTGTESGATADTTYSFTIRATDAEGQTADRAFTITITLGANNSGQFN